MGFDTMDLGFDTMIWGSETFYMMGFRDLLYDGVQRPLIRWVWGSETFYMMDLWFRDLQYHEYCFKSLCVICINIFFVFMFLVCKVYFL